MVSQFSTAERGRAKKETLGGYVVTRLKVRARACLAVEGDGEPVQHVAGEWRGREERDIKRVHAYAHESVRVCDCLPADANPCMSIFMYECRGFARQPPHNCERIHAWKGEKKTIPVLEHSLASSSSGDVEGCMARAMMSFPNASAFC